jgi:alpha-beta hydrolase superfamily lysophospholipase
MDWSFVAVGIGILTLAVIVHVLNKYVRIILNIFLDISAARPPRPHDLDGEPVNFPSLDGVSLSGMFLRALAPPKGTVIFCHESGADGSSAADYALFLRDHGFHLFTFDFRGHGQSSNLPHYRPRGWPSTHEVDDLLGAVAYVRSRPEAGDAPVGLMGVSRGGGVAILAAAHSPAVGAVVTDGAFSTRLTLHAYMLRWVGLFSDLELIYRHLPNWVYRGIRTVAMFVVQVRLRCLFPSVRRAIRRLAPRPIFMIHGERDATIDKSQAVALFNMAGEPKQLWIVPGARHNESVQCANGEYQGRVAAFFLEHLNHQPPSRAQQRGGMTHDEAGQAVSAPLRAPEGARRPSG